MYRIGQEEIDEVSKVIKSKKLFRVNDNYREVDNFEKEWAQKIGAKYALCVSGGTNALIAALAGLGIGPGDEVIIPGYTFMATATAVLAVGAIPVIAEIDDSLTIDPVDVEKRISSYTKAIIPVHILGYPCNMEKLLMLAQKYNLKILEDACQADGGSYKGKRLGSWGDAGAFSFNDFKILTAGEGGAVVTDNQTVYERALIYHDGGAAFRPYAKELSVQIFTGTQNRVSEVTGALLRVQLKRLEGILYDLRKIKNQFIEEISDMSKATFARSNDIHGDCGTTVTFSFADEKIARAFAKSEGVEGWLPIDSGKHVYSNWDPVLNKRAGHHAAINPYKMIENKGMNIEYSKNMCPASLTILSRTVNISLNPDWTLNEIENRINSCRKAISKI